MPLSLYLFEPQLALEVGERRVLYKVLEKKSVHREVQDLVVRRASARALLDRDVAVGCEAVQNEPLRVPTAEAPEVRLHSTPRLEEDEAPGCSQWRARRR